MLLSLFFLHPVNGDPRDNAEDGDDDDRDDGARFATESGFSGRQLLMLRENREKPPQRKVKATFVFISLLSLLFILLFFIFCNQKSSNDLLEREREEGEWMGRVERGSCTVTLNFLPHTSGCDGLTI